MAHVANRLSPYILVNKLFYYETTQTLAPIAHATVVSRLFERYAPAKAGSNRILPEMLASVSSSKLL